VFVRPLSMDEGRKLQRITRSSKDPVRFAPGDRGDDVRPRPGLPECDDALSSNRTPQ
jgi:hypothetical protein